MKKKQSDDFDHGFKTDIELNKNEISYKNSDDDEKS